MHQSFKSDNGGLGQIEVLPADLLPPQIILLQPAQCVPAVLVEHRVLRKSNLWHEITFDKASMVCMYVCLYVCSYLFHENIQLVDVSSLQQLHSRDTEVLVEQEHLLLALHLHTHTLIHTYI